MCFLIFFSFGLKFIWKRGIGHVGHHQWRWENPSHFTHAPFLPTSSFGQHANKFWQTYSNLLWTTCKNIWANTIFSTFLVDKMQVYLCRYIPTCFGQHAYYIFPTLRTACKCIFTLWLLYAKTEVMQKALLSKD